MSCRSSSTVSVAPPSMSVARAMSSPRAMIVSARFASSKSNPHELMLLQKSGCQERPSSGQGSHEEALGVRVDDEHWTYPRLGGEVEWRSSNRLSTRGER